MHFFLLALLHNLKLYHRFFLFECSNIQMIQSSCFLFFFLPLLNKIHRWENAYENFLIHGIAIESDN